MNIVGEIGNPIDEAEIQCESVLWLHWWLPFTLTLRFLQTQGAVVYHDNTPLRLQALLPGRQLKKNWARHLLLVGTSVREVSKSGSKHGTTVAPGTAPMFSQYLSYQDNPHELGTSLVLRVLWGQRWQESAQVGMVQLAQTPPPQIRPTHCI